MVIISIIGPPGSGKGYYSNIFKKEYGFYHLALGTHLRKIPELKPLLEKGNLVPSKYVEDILYNFFQTNQSKHVILDGMPRRREDLAILDRVLTLSKKKIDYLLILEVNKSRLIDRLITNKRVQCTNPDCGTTYNLKTAPPKVEGICDNCNGVLKTRSDDTLETFEKRLKLYFQELSFIETHFSLIAKRLKLPESDEEINRLFKDIIPKIMDLSYY